MVPMYWDGGIVFSSNNGLCIKRKQITITTTFSSSLFLLLSHIQIISLGLLTSCAAGTPGPVIRLADLQGKLRWWRAASWKPHLAQIQLSSPINVLRRPFYPVCERKSARSAGKQRRADGYRSAESQAGKALTKPKMQENNSRSACDLSVQKSQNTSAHPGRETLFFYML